MKYTVLWKPAAEQQLAELWTSSADRKDITAPAHQIDILLKHDPQSRGESRSGNNRVLIVRPLPVVFRVHEPDRTVFVSDVWRFRRKGHCAMLL